MATTDPPPEPDHITLIGTGTIGLSFAALHLTANPTAIVTLYDPRPDLETYIATHLPTYLPAGTPDHQSAFSSRLRIAPSLPEAVATATYIQEQGPETLPFKSALWPQIAAHAPPTALFWSSTSGIPASAQAASLDDPAAAARLIVVHPYNPPHVMPLLELVPSPQTSRDTIARTQRYWRRLGRAPVLLRKECQGFVANRLAFALLREACALVASGVVSVEDLDAVVTSSMGPRWAVSGPFQAYHAGGGEGGLGAFMEKIGGTVQGCWEAGEEAVREHGIVVGGSWQEGVCAEAEKAYGVVDTKARDARTRRVLEAARVGGGKSEEGDEGGRE